MRKPDGGVAMTTLLPALGTAQRRDTIPKTEYGVGMPLATLYAVFAPDGTPEGHVVITTSGVYQATSGGEIHDFFICLYQRPAWGSHADALVQLGYSLTGAR